MATDATAQLIHLANHFGADPEFARAGGGNASVKSDGILLIKPSGTTLADLRAADLIPLRLEPLMEALVTDESGTGDPVMAAAERARVGDPGGRRPSVEILFHALIPDALVLHLHPLVANAVTCNEQGRALTEQLLGDEALWVDYIDPGVPLARGIARARAEFQTRTGTPAPGITLLGNHGIIVSGDTFDEVEKRTTWLTATIRGAVDAAALATPTQPDESPAGAPSALVDTLAEHFRQTTGSTAVATDADAFISETTVLTSGPVSRGPLIPDQIVYSGSLPVLLGVEDNERAVALAVEQFRNTHGRSPVTAVVPGIVAFAVGDTDRAARNALDTFRDALRMARDADLIGRVRVMDERERHFIENWEAESYRRSIAASA